MSIVYVYALIESPRRRLQGTPRARAIQLRGHRIQLMPVGTVHAAVEPLDAPLALSEESLRAQHDIVVALARRFEAILPARFGAAVDLADLEHLVTMRQKVLRRAFDTVRGREQMTVRIFGPERPAEIGNADLPDTGTAYLHRRLDTARLGGIRRAVKPVIVRERIDPGRGRVRATLHHLVRRGCAAAYESLVKRTLHDLPSQDDVVVSGPWPPFAFTPDLWP
jgi:hypothetical protein